MAQACERSIAAQGIVRLLWGLFASENGLDPFVEMPEAARKRLQPLAEFVVNVTVNEDRFDAALMCMADVLCMDGSPDCTIDRYDDDIKRHYYDLAVSAVHALQENVKEVPPDANYRDRMCRLVDAIAPKGGAR